jgi:hypothetical protein
VTEEHKGKQMIREDRGQVRGDSGIGKPQSENFNPKTYPKKTFSGASQIVK